jgi:autotransporter translocation and assembly factor TamB
MRSKTIKTIGILFAFLILLVIAISLFSQTAYFRNTLRNVIERVVTSSTGQVFTIGKIEGDLIHGLRLKDVSFMIDGEPFVQVEEAYVQYSIPLILDSSMLFNRIIPLKDVSTRGVSINFTEEEEGNWNVEKLVPKEKDKLKEKIKTTLSWSILIQDSLLNDARITLKDSRKKDILNIEISKMDFSLKMLGLTDKIDVDLKEGDLSINQNLFYIKGLSTNVIYTDDKTQIKELEGDLNGIKIKFDGELDDFIEPRFKFKAAAYGLDINKGVLNLEVEDAKGQYKTLNDIQADVKLKLLDSQIMGKKVQGSIEKMKMAGTKLEIQKGVIKTEFGETSFNGNAKLDGILSKEGSNNFDFKITLKDIETSEILTLFEKKKETKIVDTDLSARINANFDASGRWNEIEDLQAKVNIDDFQLKGDKAGKFDLKGLVEGSKSNVKLDVISNLSKVNLALILGDEKYTSDINSNLNIKGSVPLSGDLLDNLIASVQGEILQSSGFGINLTGGQIDASYRENILTIKSLSLNSDSFKLKAQGKEAEKRMDFSYEAEVKDLSLLSKFLPEVDLKGSLKSDGRVQGEIKNPQVTFSATVSDFWYNGVEVKSINLSGDTVVNLTSPKLQLKGNLKELKFRDKVVKGVDIQARTEGKGLRGNFSITESAQRYYEIKLKLVDLTSEEKNLEIEKIRLSFKNSVIENKDTIDIKLLPSQLIIKSLNFYHNNNFILGNADVVFDGNMNASLELKKVSLNDISEILELKPSIEGITSGNISLQGTLEKPIINANIGAKDLGFKGLRSDNSNLTLSYSNKNLSLNFIASENAREILSANGGANVDLNLKKIGENIEKAVLDLTINSDGLDLNSLANLNSEAKELKGVVSVNISLEGTIEKPNIMAKISAKDLVFKQFKSDKIGLSTSYLNKKLNLNLNIEDNGREILFARGNVDIDLDFKKIGENLNQAYFDITMKSNGVDLSPLVKLNEEIKNIQGLAVLDFRAYGKVSSPNVKGQAKLQDVLLRIHSLRDDIKITNGIFEMEGEKGFLKTLEIQTDGGKGTFQGEINFNKLSYTINGKMDNLQIMPKGITARIDGDVKIEGSDGKIHISGDTKVRNARIKIPDLPTKKVEDIKFVDEQEEEFAISETKQTDYYRDNVAMDLKVTLPGNAWVKGKGANIEIKGKIGVTKKYTKPLIITGNITTVRGTYEFFGKLFKIQRGEVSFRGTPEINPFLDVTALYKVSNVNIFVSVSGTAEKPKIELSSEPPMDQTEIFSYLLFGTSSEKLGVGERVSLEQKATQAVALMAAGQLKGIIGEQFGLDIISIASGEGGFKGTEIEVGKYFTDKLYIAYQRSSPFTQTVIQSASTSPDVIDQVHVEYKLFNFLTLESEISGYQSGADIFYNFSY